MNYKPNTRIEFLIPKNEYVEGSGVKKNFIPIEHMLCGVKNTAFYCEWRGGFGADVLAADSMNIKEFGTIRMSYHPEIYKALCKGEVKIYRAGDKKPFKAVGSPDNYLMQNRIIEFKVARLESK